MKITQHNVPMGRMGESIDVANAAVMERATRHAERESLTI